MMDDLLKLKYPIGKWKAPDNISPDDLKKAIKTIKNFPANLSKVINSLTDNQLDTPYRPEGWTVRQLVHHCADSHMNSIIRFKLALTEENPVVKAYKEAEWANLPDSKKDIAPSIQILEGLHYRWAELLKGMSPADYKKTFRNSESNKEWSLETATLLYEWHCNHHLAHVTELIKRKAW